ncbi:MAG: EutN/CcmL family microcompartment protein [Acidobacteriia bacterium]|nr:EutN/CcmL family microcompartment protein [Terriglobia bacterium]
MRLGIVRGNVVLSLSDPSLVATRFLIVEPVTAQALAAQDGTGGGKQLIVADHLAPAEGQMIAFVEGREAANPYWPGRAPLDAYCSLLVDTVDYHPPGARGKSEKRTTPGKG